MSKVSRYFGTLLLTTFIVSIFSASIVLAENDFSITLTSPNGGEALQGGNAYQITWEQKGIDSVHLDWSTGPSSGNSIAWNLKVDPQARTGSYTWTIPPEFNLFEKYPQFKIKVTAYKTGVGSASDESDNSFTIAPAPEVDEKTFSAIDLLSPNGGEVFYDNEKIQLAINQKNLQDISVRLWTGAVALGSQFYRADAGTTTGIYEFQVPKASCAMPDVQVKIKVLGTSSHPRAPSVSDESADYVTIRSSPDHSVKPMLQLLTPNGGETFHPGDMIAVSWAQNDIKNVMVYVLQDSLINTASSFDPTKGLRIDPYPAPSDSLTNFQWKIPDTMHEGRYKIWMGGLNYFCSYARFAGYDWSDNFFTIARPPAEPVQNGLLPIPPPAVQAESLPPPALKEQSPAVLPTAEFPLVATPAPSPPRQNINEAESKTKAPKRVLSQEKTAPATAATRKMWFSLFRRLFKVPAVPPQSTGTPPSRRFE